MNECRYCDQPAKRVLCGAAECKRKYNADRGREYMRARRAQAKARLGPRACPGCGVEVPRSGKRLWCTTKCKSRIENRRANGSKPLFRIRAERLVTRSAKGSKGNVLWIVASSGDITPTSLGPWTKPSAITEAYRSGNTAELVRSLLSRTREAGDCRLWTGRVDGNGYSKIRVDGRYRSAHRLVAEATHGPLRGEPVHHTCATPLCIAPTHNQ